MPDLTAELIPLLKSHRLPGLDLGESPAAVVYPHYSGFSILNLPSSICRLFEAPDLGAPALEARLLTPLLELKPQRIILILVDALGLGVLQRWMAAGQAQLWERLARQGWLAPLTSITPSTTSAALASLWTGRSSAEHGITGYEMWLKEYGVVANTLLHAPSSYANDTGSLTKAGFNPQTFMSFPTLGTHLANYGVKTHVFQHHSILNSGLSQMIFQDARLQPYATFSELCVNLRQLLERQAVERQYIYVYWSDVDTFSHRYGPDDERTANEFHNFSRSLEELLLNPLRPQARRDTLLMLAADHGQISTPPDPYYDLSNHPGLMRRLHIRPTGENRLAYLYIRPGQTEAVREYVERTWPNQFMIIDPAYAVEAGLFGPGASHPRLLDRLGDMILIARGPAYLWWADKENHLMGRHGGLHPDEMLVPFLAARL